MSAKTKSTKAQEGKGVRIWFPQSALPLIDKAAAKSGHTRMSLINESVRAAVEGIAEDAAFASNRNAEKGNALIHCGIQIGKLYFLNLESASADMECLAACLQGHPDLQQLRRALLRLSKGIDEIERLANSMDEDVSGAALQKLNASEKWVGGFFQTLIGRDGSFEDLMCQLDGLGDIISKHEQTASLGRMLMEMERSYDIIRNVEKEPVKGLQSLVSRPSKRPAARPVETAPRQTERRAA